MTTLFEKAEAKLKTILTPEKNFSGTVNMKNGKKLQIERDKQGFYFVYLVKGNKLKSLGRFDWTYMVETVLEEGK